MIKTNRNCSSEELSRSIGNLVNVKFNSIDEVLKSSETPTLTSFCKLDPETVGILDLDSSDESEDQVETFSETDPLIPTSTDHLISKTDSNSSWCVPKIELPRFLKSIFKGLKTLF